MNKKKKIIIYIKNMKDPSAYYRLGQYFYTFDKNILLIKYAKYSPDNLYNWYYDKELKSGYMKKIILAIIGIIRNISYILWDIVFYHSDIVIINRQIFPRIMPKILKNLLVYYYKRRTVYWDFDDNIIFDNEITKCEKMIIEAKSNKIIVTNEYLKNTLIKEYQNKVYILHTTDITFKDLDLNQTNKKRLAGYENIVNLIWVGTKSNLKYIKNILPILDRVALELEVKFNKKVCLKFICNVTLDYIPNKLIIENIIWSRKKAIDELYNAHIGLMPLEDNEFTRGKGGFKAIQYISAGIPAIVSDVGYNINVIQNNVNGFLVNSETDWYESLLQLCVDKNLWIRISLAARKFWNEKYNGEANSKFWNNVIKTDNINNFDIN